MQAPERLIVGHPFNPPHLVPLVEVVRSKTTDPAVVDLALAFYTSVGKRPQVLGREIAGFIANLLQSALFREAVYLVSQGSRASRRSMTSSRPRSGCGGRSQGRSAPPPGRRAGWPGRLPRPVGPGLEALWPQLGDPSLDPQTLDLLTKQAGGFGGTVAELAEQRDDAEIRLMRALDEIPLPQ
jgi:ketoreductase RED1